MGGHHKVPMAELRMVMAHKGFKECVTVLNSGNVIFKGPDRPEKLLETEIADALEQRFGFAIPVLIRTAKDLEALHAANPFGAHVLTEDLRFYVSFLKNAGAKRELPMKSDDGSFLILAYENKALFGILNVTVNKTPNAMMVLEKHYGSGITTRNWKTITRIVENLRP